MSNGIVLGDNGKFRPDEPVTRAEIVAMLYRALTADQELRHLELLPVSQYSGQLLLRNRDVSLIDKRARNYLQCS
ncbi:S-layer homology domain-containing protein [Paenibacillus pinisoli]|uniref:S-layer homology domain-containing protein n=1 Tax=Paenibacillus pinisoli TaxID=1276110 RepID=A0A3A6PG59_9BACL|nr:S-layer homology domain-containing protein [Paenibacillus pinisoli]